MVSGRLLGLIVDIDAILGVPVAHRILFDPDLLKGRILGNIAGYAICISPISMLRSLSSLC